MAISPVTATTALEAQIPLLDNDDAVYGYADWKCRPVKRSKSGGWRSASFILAAGAIERFSYYGIETNLINYLTGQLGLSVATAAVNVNTWVGVNWLVPILGALVADSFLGRYGTIILTSILCILGFGSLSLLAMIISNSRGTTEKNATGSDTTFQILVFLSLYLVSIGQGYKPCVQAFGADQFDSKHPEERKEKSSFFNWWFGGLCIGGVVSHLTLHFIQDYINWTLGFGIPCLAMIVGLILFLLGTGTYRFSTRKINEETRGIAKVRKIDSQFAAPAESTEEEGQEALRISSYQGSECNKFPGEVLPATDKLKTSAVSCSTNKINNYSKIVLRLIPIWTTCLVYGIAYAQGSTLFTKQANTVDKSIGKNFVLPSASLRTFLPLAIIIFTPIYDKIFIPIARMMTGKPSGITMLQRIGTGMVLSAITMLLAALIEKKRLQTAEEFGVIDIPNATVPMSFWWLVPQYVLFGLADVFALVGMQEFFYDQVPTELGSVGLSLYLSAIGIGNFLSSFLISVIKEATGGNGRDSWFSDNLNHAHIDYFYWLLAGLNSIGLIAFIYFAKSYRCKVDNAIC